MIGTNLGRLTATSEIWEYIKSHVAMALLIFVAVLIVSILSANGFLDAAIVNGFIADANNWVRTLVALIVLSLFYLIFSMAYYPVHLHIEQEKEKEELQAKVKRLQKIISGGPILRVKEYGNANKKTYLPFDSTLTGDYDTLIIDVFNKQVKGFAEKVWSEIEWIKNGETVLTHRGRWHIAADTMWNEPVKENLQYRDIGSNQSAEKLYFAWTYADGRENCFHGLERDADGRDSWGTSKYTLNDKEYTVRITLHGNDGIHQEFIYVVKNDGGKISIKKALTNESKQETKSARRKKGSSH